MCPRFSEGWACPQLEPSVVTRPGLGLQTKAGEVTAEMSAGPNKPVDRIQSILSIAEALQSLYGLRLR